MSEDLRDKITAAIDRAEQVARDANRLDWEVWRSQPISVRATFGDLALAHVIEHSPAAVLRRCAADRRVLERHLADDECTITDCLEIEDLADRWGVEVQP